MFSASKSGQYPGYLISRSVRLRSSASAYFNRTPASAGNRKTWTWSGWVKLGALGTAGTLFSTDNTISSQNVGQLFISSSGQLSLQNYSTVIVTVLTTNAVYRDPSAWYHFVAVFDTSNATSANRQRLYVNGVEQTSFASRTDPSLNYDGYINAAVAHSIGDVLFGTRTNKFDGYLTEINFIDGQALTPSSFGAYNAYGVWSPMKYNGTYGTNGFYLNFSDPSAATAAAIGADRSGNGNNWTPNNISVTAGVTYDSMLDVPTPWPDGGNGRGNYCVLSPLDVIQNSPGTLSNGNLSRTESTATNSGTFGTFTVTSGKWYWEVVPTAISSTTANIFVAVMEVTATPTAVGLRPDGSRVGSTGTAATYTTNDVMGVAVDIGGNSIAVYKNGTLITTLTPSTALAAIKAAVFDGTTATGAVTASFNFGQRPFAYTPPTGFLALNTQNLPTPTIANGALYMAATTYTGTGASRSVDNTLNNVSFQPDFVWVKGRSGATDHALYDAVRGVQLQLESNTTAAETTETTGLTAFNSNGFTVGALAQMNTNTATYVGWQWKANGTPAVTNTAGSITSTVSAGATQGFSVVTYTANASQTIGHGLGVAPRMIIIKSRQYVTDWIVYHANLGNTGYVALNTTAAFTTNAGVFNNTSPTSSVFTIGSGFTTALWGNSVAYCFAEVAGFSRFGSYTGNGSADGPFVFCGFRPAFVMVKVTSAVVNWWIQDTSRSPSNVSDDRLFPNLSNAEAVNSVYNIDFLSNGFKVRGTGTATNDNGATYIFAAFAESPFKFALAR